MELKIFPEVYQAVAGKENVGYAYMNDGRIRKFDVQPLLDLGGVFLPLRDRKIFLSALAVRNGTAAWDLDGGRDESRCIDIDPFAVEVGAEVEENMEPGLADCG